MKQNSRTRARGFTIIELMIVIALLAVVATIAVPSFTQFTRNNQTQAQSDEILRFLQYARSQAVSSRKTYEVSINAAGVWSVGPQGGEAERIMEIRSELSISVENGSISFSPNGLADPATEVVICHGQDAANGFTISVPRSGGARRFARGYKDDNGGKLSSCS